MESRIREGQNKLIDVFALLMRGKNENSIVWCYPENGLNEEMRKSVPRFAFPFRDKFKSSNIDYFTFVLTDIDGKFKFGFCRMSAGSDSTLCLISSYPWFEIFYKILDHLSDSHNSNENGAVQMLFQQLWDFDPSAPGKSSLSFKVLGNQFTIQYPDPDKLPSIPESRNLTEYYNAIDGHNMLIIFASMLFERRIIVTSRKLSRLTACVYGATSLIYPLNWQHIFIPVLPYHLIDYISAPMPYLIGVHSSVFEMAKPGEIADAVIVDADARKVTFSHGDLSSLPISIVNSLKKDLDLHRNGNHCSLTGDKLSCAFLKAMVSLIGGYRKALAIRDRKIAFNPDIFLQSHPSNMQAFLHLILQSQSFEQFIEERLSLSRHIKGYSDVFERAVLAAEEKNKQHKGGSVKNKMNHIIQDKVLVDIKKKVKSTGVKTFSSVKKKLDFKKNEDQPYGKNATANKDATITAKSQVSDVRFVETKHNGDTTDIISPLLRKHPSNLRSSAIKNRDIHFMGVDNCELLDELRIQSDTAVTTEPDRSSYFQKYSFDDLEISNPAFDHDIVNLSSVSVESCHNGSQYEHTSADPDLRHTLIKDIWKEENGNEDDRSSFSENSVHETVEEVSEDDPSDKDSVFELPSLTRTEDVRKNPDLLLTFPSVRQIRKALQASSPVKRKAIISVQELPSVKQLVQKLEASAKPHEAKADTSHPGVGTSFVANQAAMYSLLDRKARSSLTRKHAIRATSQKMQPSEDKDVEAELDSVSEKRLSFLDPKSERYLDLMDSVKRERNYLSPDLPADPRPNGFGCLLRVSSRSASMRQFDMEQRQFSSIKRISPPSDRCKKEIVDSRKAVYHMTSSDLENEAVTKESESESLSRNGNRVSRETVVVKMDVTDSSQSEVIINLPLNDNCTADDNFVSKCSRNRDGLYIPPELDSTDEPVADCKSSEPARNRVAVCIPLEAYPAEESVSFTFKLTDGVSCDAESNDSRRSCRFHDGNTRSDSEETEPIDKFCGNYNSSAEELECERLTTDSGLPENLKGEDNVCEQHHFLESSDEARRSSDSHELQNASHRPSYAVRTEEYSNLFDENWASLSVHETSEFSDDSSR